MSFYEGMANTASSLLTKFGKTITIRRTVGGTIDPVTGAVVAGVVTDYTPNGLFQKINNQIIDGTRIKVGDKMFVIDNTFEPLISDKVLMGSIYWNIEEITPVEPADSAIVYFVRIRK